jgi:hypothetical protein
MVYIASSGLDINGEVDAIETTTGARFVRRPSTAATPRAGS